MKDNYMRLQKIRKGIKTTACRMGIWDTAKRFVLVAREKKYEAMNEDEKRESLVRWYKKMTGEDLNLENPANFNQKIQWLKLYDFTPMKTMLSDKYLVRTWVGEKIGSSYLVPLLGVWDAPEDIDFSGLPERFVLKANHGSEMNYIVKKEAGFDEKKARQIVGRWLKTPYDLSGMEQQYYAIQRKIIAEQYIEQNDGNLFDYKIHCFNGEPEIIQVIGDRNLSKHTGKEAFCDIEWNRNDLMYITYEPYSEMPEKPKTLPEMLRIARQLSQGFIYVRVDLYSVDNRVYFGEMTFTPASGIGKWKENDKNALVGSWITPYNYSKPSKMIKSQ